MRPGIKSGSTLSRILDRHLLVAAAAIAGLCLLVAAGFSQTGRHSGTQLSSAVMSRVRGDGGGGAAACTAAITVPKVALMFLVRHEAYHGALWTAWLDSVNGLLPAAALHWACCRGDTARRVSVRSPAVDAFGDDSSAGNGSAAAVSGSRQLLYTVYVHDSAAEPADYEPGSFFYGHRIANRTETWWGSSSLDVASKLVLRAALAEASNQRFVMLGESAVPLYSAAAVYLQLMGETKSRIHSCKEPPPGHIEARWGRWVDTMAAGDFNISHFRESSQWKALTREHAQIIDADTFVLERFFTRCPPDQHGWECITDEHYMPSVLAYAGVGADTTCNPNPVMEVNWRQVIPGHVHPYAYTVEEATPQNMAFIRLQGPACQPYLTVRAGEREGSFIHMDELHDIKCQPEPFLPPFELARQSWPAEAQGNVHCPLFSRKWPAETAPAVMDALQLMRVVA